MLNKLRFSVVNTVSSKLRIHNQIYTPNPLCNIKFVNHFYFALYEQCFIYMCIYIFFNFQRNLHIEGKDWTTSELEQYISD